MAGSYRTLIGSAEPRLKTTAVVVFPDSYWQKPNKRFSNLRSSTSGRYALVNDTRKKCHSSLFVQGCVWRKHETLVTAWVILRHSPR